MNLYDAVMEALRFNPVVTEEEVNQTYHEIFSHERIAAITMGLQDSIKQYLT